MDEVYLYIKRLISFILCAVCIFILKLYLPSYLVFAFLPALLVTLSILHYRVTGERPPHLFAFYRTGQFFKNGGLHDIPGIIVTIFGFLYDMVVWTAWGIYLVFQLFVDLVDFIKTLIYWMIHATLWFLRQYVPFFKFVYRLFIFYIIQWPWELYQIAFSNIRFAFNLNCYKVSIAGTLPAALILFLSYYLGIYFENITGILFIGFALALLPITWIFGEIANIRARQLENETFRQVRLNFQNGIEAVRSVLFYIALFVMLMLMQLGFNMLGWIPGSGILIAGFVFNLNTFISFIMLSLCIIIIMGIFIIPSYRLYVPFNELRFSHSIKLLSEIFKKCLRFFAAAIPVKVFTAIIMLIPVAVLCVVYWASFNIKNSVTQVKIDKLKLEQTQSGNATDAYIIGKQIEYLKYLQRFPEGLSGEFMNQRKLVNAITTNLADAESAKAAILLEKEEYSQKVKDLQYQIDNIKKTSTYNAPGIEELTKRKDRLQVEYSVNNSILISKLTKLNIDIESLKLKKKQIPVLFFLGGLWIVIFGSLAAAFALSYIGNVVHQIYRFRNNDQEAEWKVSISRIKEEDNKQPLLGGTLFVITLLLLYFLFIRNNRVGELISIIKQIL